MESHPFLRQAIGRFKVGKGRPIWYDTIIEKYPPILYAKSKSGSFRNLDQIGPERDPLPTREKEAQAKEKNTVVLATSLYKSYMNTRTNKHSHKEQVKRETKKN